MAGSSSCQQAERIAAKAPLPTIRRYPFRGIELGAQRHFVRSALLNPLVVGAHWFQLYDEPTTGRGDDAVCHHCGQTNCPSECGWGMTDPQGKPKPAYDVFKSLAPEYF